MEIRKQLADRLRNLMDSRVDLDTQTKVANRSGVGQSTIQRLLACEQAATVDMLAKISRAFGLKPYEMLIDDLHDANLLRSFSRLSEVEKTRIQGFIELTLSINGQSGHHAGAQLFMDTRAPVLPQLTAATKRASARRPGSDITRDTVNEKAGKLASRRKS